MYRQDELERLRSGDTRTSLYWDANVTRWRDKQGRFAKGVGGWNVGDDIGAAVYDKFRFSAVQWKDMCVDGSDKE